MPLEDRPVRGGRIENDPTHSFKQMNKVRDLINGNFTLPIRKRLMALQSVFRRQRICADIRKLVATFLLNLEIDYEIVSRFLDTGQYEMIKHGFHTIDFYDQVERPALEQGKMLALQWFRWRRGGPKRLKKVSSTIVGGIFHLGDYFVELAQRHFDLCVENTRYFFFDILFERYGQKHRHLCVSLAIGYFHYHRLKGWSFTRKEVAFYVDPLVERYPELNCFYHL